MNPNDPQQGIPPQGEPSQPPESTQPVQPVAEPVTQPEPSVVQPVAESIAQLESTQPVQPVAEQVTQPEQPAVQPTAPQQLNQPVAGMQPPVQSQAPKSGKKVLIPILIIAAVILLPLMGLIVFNAISAVQKVNNSPTNKSALTSSTTASYMSKSACALFTQTDAQGLIGADGQGTGAATPTLKNNVYTSSCTYASGSTGDTVIVLLQSAANSDGVANIESQWSQIKSAGLASVSGLGDSAYYNSAKQVLAVKKGEVVFDVSVAVSSGDPQTLCTEVAQVIVGRL